MARGPLARAGILGAFIRVGRGAVVTDAPAAPLYLERLTTGLRASGIDLFGMVLPDGEAYKNWETLNAVYDRLVEAHCDRQATLIALGGGSSVAVRRSTARSCTWAARSTWLFVGPLAQVDSS